MGSYGLMPKTAMLFGLKVMFLTPKRAVKEKSKHWSRARFFSSFNATFRL
jgi:hypothetical protein